MSPKKKKYLTQDYDYLDKLNPEERAFLEAFDEVEYQERFTEENAKILNVDLNPALRSKISKRRNRSRANLNTYKVFDRINSNSDIPIEVESEVILIEDLINETKEQLKLESDLFKKGHITRRLKELLKTQRVINKVNK